MTERKHGWTPEDYERWTWLFGTVGAFWALVWLGTDWWFFGLCSIVCLGMAFWAWMERDRQ